MLDYQPSGHAVLRGDLERAENPRKASSRIVGFYSVAHDAKQQVLTAAGSLRQASRYPTIHSGEGSEKRRLRQETCWC